MEEIHDPGYGLKAVTSIGVTIAAVAVTVGTAGLATGPFIASAAATGAVAGTIDSAAKQGIDIHNGHRKEFDVGEMLGSCIGGGVIGASLATVGRLIQARAALKKAAASESAAAAETVATAESAPAQAYPSDTAANLRNVSELKFDQPSLQHAYGRHGAQLGMGTQNWNATVGQHFETMLIQATHAPDVVLYDVAYRGQPGYIMYHSAKTGTMVLYKAVANIPAGKLNLQFTAAFPLSKAQLTHVIADGNLN